MKIQLSAIGVILILGIMTLSGCVGQATKDFNKEYDADENTILQVTNINGPITITQWTEDTVSVDATMRSNIGKSELDNIKIEVIESKNLIDIETTYLGSGSVQVSTDMNIKVPSYVTIDTVSSSNGEVKLIGLKGNTTAHSSNGAVILQDVDGYVDASTSNGRVEIKDTTGIANVQSSNGDIYVEVFDFINHSTISTSNGEISVYIKPSLNADIEMTTSNGKISLSGITLNVSILEDKHVVGSLGDGSKNIDISTSNGNINLYKLDV